MAYNPGAGVMPDYDVYVNDEFLQKAAFRTVTPYVSVRAGANVKVGIKAVGSTNTSPYVSLATFAAPSNSFYTVGFTGPLEGPVGQVTQRTNPFINPDLRRVPNPGRATGLWYRWSETPAAVDFRAVSGDPMNSDCNLTCISYLNTPAGGGCPTCAITQAPDVERISDLIGKTIITLSEFETGTYSFYPTLVGKNDPLWNVRFNNGAGGVVGTRSLQVEGAVPITNGARGKWYDFFAQGDSLLKANANNLEVQLSVTTVEHDVTSGCTFVVDARNARVPTRNTMTVTSGAAAASAGVAAMGLVGVLLAASTLL